MKRSAYLALCFALTLPGLGSSAQSQTTPGCTDHCYGNYSTRANYCYEKYGGYNYDAELCIMNEWEAYQDCLRGCEEYSSNNTSPNPLAIRQSARANGRPASDVSQAEKIVDPELLPFGGVIVVG